MAAEPVGFATTAEQRIEQARHESVRGALHWLTGDRDDRVELANLTLYSGVMYQARLAGCGV